MFFVCVVEVGYYGFESIQSPFWAQFLSFVGCVCVFCVLVIDE